MKKIFLALFTFLVLPALLYAQPASPPSFIIRVPFASLPVGVGAGAVRTITNSDGAGCNGNGASDFTCQWNGSAWVALANAGTAAALAADPTDCTQSASVLQYAYAIAANGNLTCATLITIQAIAPTADDDTGDGYIVGTKWILTDGSEIYEAVDVTAAAAVWRKIYPFVEAQTAQSVFALGKEITGANSLLNAFRVGDGTTPMCLYTDATDGPVITPCTASNIRTRIPTDFTWGLTNNELSEDMEVVDPDAASTLAMWSYPNAAYRPKKSIWFPAGSLSVDGTQCAAPAEVTINSGPKIWTIICTDNDASTIYGSVRMPDSWDGGTVTFTHSYIQTAADTGVLNGDIACQARSNGEVPSSTYGTEVALDDAAVVGSNSNDMITSAAATCAGTGLAGGDMLYFRYQLDATGTTTAVATLHHLGFNMEYSTLSRSD